MKKNLGFLFGMFLAASFCQNMNADVIAGWTFESLGLSYYASPGANAWLTNITAEIGQGTASAFHSSATTYTTVTGNGSADALSSATWSVGDFYQFAVSTATNGGYFSGITLSWDQTASGTGPGRFNLEYSIGGSSWSTFATDYQVLTNGSAANNAGSGIATSAWTASTVHNAYHFSYDLSSIFALANNSQIYFRLVDDSTTSAGLGTVSTIGTERIDNFTVNGTLVALPEPSTFTLATLGGLLVFLVRQGRDKKE